MTTIGEQMTAQLTLVSDTADAIRSLLPEAARARGVQSSSHPARQASDEVNRLILEFADTKGGNLTELSRVMAGDITYAGLRRRLRVARSGVQLGAEGLRKGHGDKDPEKIAAAAAEIRESKTKGGEVYRSVVRKHYEAGLNLQVLSKELGQSYYSLWALLRS